MVADPRQLADDHANILAARRRFDAQQLFHRQMPGHVVRHGLFLLPSKYFLVYFYSLSLFLLPFSLPRFVIIVYLLRLCAKRL